jgi:hypothetical protein
MCAKVVSTYAGSTDSDGCAENNIRAAASYEAHWSCLVRALKLNFVLRAANGINVSSEEIKAELGCHYRVPHVRCIVRTRMMCQTGRARAAGARRRGCIVAWLCERAPLWVVVHVCMLLREV